MLDLEAKGIPSSFIHETERKREVQCIPLVFDSMFQGEKRRRKKGCKHSGVSGSPVTTAYAETGCYFSNKKVNKKPYWDSRVLVIFQQLI